MAELAEFYIACNPPLLPRGVSEVIRRVQETETEGLYEILYEPHAPWFKCIALSRCQSQIITAVQDNLFAMADEDVDVLDVEEQTDGDIALISSDPRFTSWAEWKRHGSDAYHFADADVFPEAFTDAKFKTLWHGLQEGCRPPATFDGLLARCSELTDGAVSPEHEQFEAVTRCQVSYSQRQAVVYIGSDESPEVLEMAVQRLDSMVEAYNRNAATKLLAAPEILPAGAVISTQPVSNDPFDGIPDVINASLQGSIEPRSAWSPRYNEGSLI